MGTRPQAELLLPAVASISAQYLTHPRSAAKKDILTNPTHTNYNQRLGQCGGGSVLGRCWAGAGLSAKEP